jgi:hypothetical protein
VVVVVVVELVVVVAAAELVVYKLFLSEIFKFTDVILSCSLSSKCPPVAVTYEYVIYWNIRRY